MKDSYELVIVGAGIAGLAALEAAVGATGDGPSTAHILILDYRPGPGGFLKITDRRGDPSPALSAEGVDTAWSTAAVGFMPGSGSRPHTIVLRDKGGTKKVKAKKVIIATGSREITREGLRVPGTRPSGIMTPALALDLLDMGLLPGREVVIYGYGAKALVLFSRLRDAGARIAEWIDTTSNAIQRSIVQISGFPRLTEVIVREGEALRAIRCDTLVVAAGVEPNVTCLKGSGVEMDETTRGPRVDGDGLTNIDGLYAVGTCVAPVQDHEASADLGARAGKAAMEALRSATAV